jgi:hypothetical protein
MRTASSPGDSLGFAVMSAPQPRPRVVTAAFRCWQAAALLLFVGGLIVDTADFPAPLPALYRGAGVITALAGAGMAFLAGRSRGGDTRFRRAGVALSLAIVVLVALVVMVGVVHVLTLLAVFPLIAGTVLITRPSSQAWFEAGEQQ